MINNIVPWPPFEPDKPRFDGTGSDYVLNALPTVQGWRDMPGPTVISDPLADEPLGSITARSADGDFITFAGTQSNLYKLDTSTVPATWTEVTQSTDYHNLGVNERWSFAQFGNAVYATGMDGEIQCFDFSSSAKFADVAGSPTVRKLFTAGDFLVGAYHSTDPNKITWSGVNDPTYWVEGYNGCDFQIFPDGVEIANGVSGQDMAIIVQRERIRGMQFTPETGAIFSFPVLNPAKGSIASDSIVNAGPNLFAFLGEDGFYQGYNAEPIGYNKVNRWFLETEIDREYLGQVCGSTDPFRNMFWWRYKSADGPWRLLGYNYLLGRWAWSDQALTDVKNLASAGVTIDGLDSLFATIDDIDIPYDSFLFQGGAPTFSGFNSSWELVNFAGGTLQATLYSPNIEHIKGRRSFVNGMYLEIQATDFTVAVAGLDAHNDARSFGSAVSPEDGDEFLALESDAKLHCYKLVIPASDGWSELVQGQIDVQDAGEI